MDLTEEQILRYSRNIALKELGGIGQQKLLNASVLVAGAGGLGSPVISYLAAAGVGRIGIIDSDKVHISNLNRQFLHSTNNIDLEKVHSAKEFVNKFNPDIMVEIHYIRLSIDNVLDIITDYDCIVDCLDTLPLKFMLNDACVATKKVLIHAGIVSFSGQLITIIPGETACLRCVIPELPENEFMPTCSQVGILGSCVGVLGSLQATEVVKYLAGLNILTNKLLVYDGLNTTFKTITVKKDEHCPVCSTFKMLSIEKYANTRTCSD